MISYNRRQDILRASIVVSEISLLILSIFIHFFTFFNYKKKRIYKALCFLYLINLLLEMILSIPKINLFTLSKCMVYKNVY